MSERRMITKVDPAWPGLRAFLHDEIDRAHIQLERTDLAEADHNLARGKIAAYREILRTVEPVEVPIDNSPGYFATPHR